MGDTSIVERDADPAAVFAALSDPTRVAILEALWEAEDHEASFSDLRAAVDVEDSGRFNYHLSKLRGRFVTSDEGTYRLRLAGRRVVGALLSGAYTGTGVADPVPIDFECPVCGGPTAFRYADEEARIVCEDCGHASMQLLIPPGVFAGYPAERLPEVADRYGRRLLRQGREFCVNCERRVEVAVRRAGELFDVDGDDIATDLPAVEYECRRCGESVISDAGNALIDHPAVVAFFHDHGVDARERRTWETLITDPERARIVADSPFRMEVTFEAGGESLVLTVDGDLDVVGTTRS